MTKKGRKPKADVTSWGETIPDLGRGPDGRWRIIATGLKFVEHDDRLAIMRFRRWQQTHVEPAGVRIDVDDVPHVDHSALQTGDDGRLRLRRERDGSMSSPRTPGARRPPW